MMIMWLISRGVLHPAQTADFFLQSPVLFLKLPGLLLKLPV
jgi:hypothetical protein